MKPADRLKIRYFVKHLRRAAPQTNRSLSEAWDGFN